ncbi:hypothetical protein P9112_010509 [Eukaryota sp. TZLM1-RC]
MLTSDFIQAKPSQLTSNLWNDQESSDFAIIYGDHTFHVHKHILAPWSGVFRSWFNSQMHEGKSGVCDLSEHRFGAQSLQEVLQYLYYIELPLSPSNIYLIYRWADYFGVDELIKGVLEKLQERLGCYHWLQPVCSQIKEHQDAKLLATLTNLAVESSFDNLLEALLFMQIREADKTMTFKPVFHLDSDEEPIFLNEDKNVLVCLERTLGSSTPKTTQCPVTITPAFRIMVTVDFKISATIGHVGIGLLRNCTEGGQTVEQFVWTNSSINASNSPLMLRGLIISTVEL